MRVLFDITHPAHLHFFRHPIERLRRQGLDVHLTGRRKDILEELARGLGLEMETFGVARSGLVHLAIEMVRRQARLAAVVRRFRPDAILAVAGTFASPVGRLFRIPTYVFYDTEHAALSNAIAYPCATCVYVPTCYTREIRWRHQRYNGYHELSYLHPSRFTADPAVLAEAGLAPGRSFSLMRFVGWGAAHDSGKRRIDLAAKRRAVDRLARFGEVVISSETALPADLEPRRLRLPVTRIHHLIAYAALVFGDSGTMSSEASVLGVPSVYVNSLDLGYLREQQEVYGIVSRHPPEAIDRAIDRAERILGDPDPGRWRAIGRRIVEEKIDVCDLVCRIALERPL